MLHPDDRSAPTGRRADAGKLGLIGGRQRLDTAVASARDLQRLMTMNPPETPTAARFYPGIEDAIRSLGLSPKAQQLARSEVKRVVEDAKDLLSVSKSLIEAGIPGPAVTELLRAANIERYRNSLEKAEGAAPAPALPQSGSTPGERGLPIGTHRQQGGRERVKVAKDEWKDAPKQGTGQAQTAGEGKDGGTGEPSPATAAKPQWDQHLADRFKRLREKAKAAGKVIHTGEGADKREATEEDAKNAGLHHGHLNELEKKLDEQIKAKNGEGEPPKPAEGAAAPAAGGGGAPAEAAAPQSAPAEPPITPENEKEPQNQHRLTQEVHNSVANLEKVKDRLESPHQKAMYEELKRDADAVKKNPSAGSVRWLNTRVLSFLALITGTALGAAVGGGLGGAMLGATEGGATRISEQPEGPVQAGIRAMAQKVTGAGKGKEAAPEKPAAAHPQGPRPVIGDLIGKPPPNAQGAAKAPGEGSTEKINKSGLYLDARGRLLIKGAKGSTKGSHKYISRKMGPNGEWQYEYPETHAPSHKKPAAKESEKKPAQQALPLKERKPAKKTPPPPPPKAGKKKPPPPPTRVSTKTVHPPTVKKPTSKPAEGAAAGIFHPETWGDSPPASAPYLAANLEKLASGKFDLTAKVTRQAILNLEEYGFLTFTGELSGTGKVEIHLTPKARNWLDTYKKRYSRKFGKVSPLIKAEGFVLRAPHPKNQWGHRDDLEPGMVLQPREQHAERGAVEVLDGGAFKLGDQIFKGGHALLDALCGEGHQTTVRRYFGLGGERTETVDVLDPLRSVLKSEGVLVQRVGSGYSLTGDLAKAGVPAYLVKAESPRFTVIDDDAAVDLHRYLSQSKE